MHDPLLEHLIELAEDDTPVETEVTLMVGGILVTGHVIGYERYMAQHALTQAWLQGDADVEGEDDAGATDEAEDDEEDFEDDEPVFVHLRDARTHAPGQPPGGIVGLYRIALGDVSGFSLVR
jgi:hypothetical protein